MYPIFSFSLRPPQQQTLLAINSIGEASWTIMIMNLYYDYGTPLWLLTSDEGYYKTNKGILGWDIMQNRADGEN